MSADLPNEADVARLLQAARQAQRRAYAPYSRFAVGAALLTADGRIHAGANVENAAYPIGVCAERNALNTMAAGGHRATVVAAAVCTSTQPPSAPCGGCRQALAEFAADDCRIWLCTPDANVPAIVVTLGYLLPLAFRPGDLLG